MQKQHSGYFAAALCNVIGILIIITVLAIVVPLVVPSMFGYDSFNVESGSMEPEIPVGSIVYVHDTAPQDIRTGEVIAFYRNETVITHRVRENRIVEGEFITKGDANPIEDIESVPYIALVGRVEYHFPILGEVMKLVTTGLGKIYLLLFAACGVMFNILASRMRYNRRRKIREAQKEAARRADNERYKAAQMAAMKKRYADDEADKESDGADSGYSEEDPGRASYEGADSRGTDSPQEDTGDSSASRSAKDKRRHKSHKVRTVIMFILLVIFLASATGVGMVLWQYRVSDELYGRAAVQYARTVSPSGKSADYIPTDLLGETSRQEREEALAERTDLYKLPAGNPIPRQEEPADQNEVYQLYEEVDPAVLDRCVKDLDPSLLKLERRYLWNQRVLAPISVNFRSLKAVNEDVKGWIYCPDTIINYPVLYGATDDTYLRHTYEKEYNIAGSIFIESENDPDLKDYNTIIYGHHMNDGSMFAGLDRWAEQTYYDEHPVIWLLTPKQDYMIVLVSGHTTSAYSDTYRIFDEPGDEFTDYVLDFLGKSDFKTDLLLPLDGHYVVLSTCAYVFDNARYVLHGLLVPVDSAGGRAIW